MFSKTKDNEKSVKAIRAREEKALEEILRGKCNAWAYERFGENTVKEWSNKYKGLFYLPILDDDDNIEKCLILQPINRHILSYASTKIESDGLYIFLEAAMIELTIEGDREIIEDEELFIPAAGKLNKIMEGKKAAILKR